MAAGERDLGPIRQAIRSRVCALCLEGGESGECRLDPGQRCALDAQLPLVVDAILSVRSRRLADFLEAVEREVCGRCGAPGADSGCRLRARGECGLCSYLRLVIEAVEEGTGKSLLDA